MITVRQVIDRVGPTLLTPVYLPEKERQVSDVAIAEPTATGAPARGDLALAVAVASEHDAVDLVETCARRAAAAALLKPPLADADAVHAAAAHGGVALVEVNAGTSWTQLVLLLRTILDAIADESEAVAEGADPDPTGVGDLFRLADAAAAVVDAPVTIEDANSRVLAYSARQDRTDPARVSTIMGRRAPDDVRAKYRSRGVFRDLSRGRSTIFVPGQPDGTLPRLIVPIRVGGQLLGSMWAVVPEPVADDRATAFAEAGAVVALHLLRRRASVDARRTRSADAVRALLDGRSSPRVAAAELRLADGPPRVLAIAIPDADGRDAEAKRLAIAERLTAGLGDALPVVELDDVLYAVVGEHTELARTLGSPPFPDIRADSLVAAGSAVAVGNLATSRAQADETLGLLRAGLITGKAAVYEHAWAQLALHRTATAAISSNVTQLGPLPGLATHDASNGTDYVATLYQWLRYHGQPRAAGQALSIHPNTLRYRLRRIRELTGVDLDDADTRLALLTQLAATRWS